MNNNVSQDKNIALNDEVLKVLVDLLNGLEQSVRQAKEGLAAVIQRIAEEKASGYVDFGFPKPLRKDAGFERFLLKVLEDEHAKHQEFTYQVRRNEQGEIVAVELRGPKEHFNHALRACSWIKQRLLAQNSRS